MSSDTNNPRRHLSGHRPNMPTRRLHGAQLPGGVLPATLQPQVFHAPTDLNELWWSPFEEAMVFVPSVGTRFPLQPLLPLSRQAPVPLIRQNAQSNTREEDSKLSKEEQIHSLKKLRRETYKPKHMYTQTARMVSRVGQYYQGKPVKSDYEYDRSANEEKCAICLEEFEPREDVSVTPCSHMFHEECIVPWVKSNGQCPVCRSTFYERVQASGQPSMQGAPVTDASRIFAAELMSIVRAIDGGIEWGHYY
ncbi:unnamed protein product [Rhodiola kirilowii]